MFIPYKLQYTFIKQSPMFSPFLFINIFCLFTVFNSRCLVDTNNHNILTMINCHICIFYFFKQRQFNPAIFGPILTNIPEIVMVRECITVPNPRVSSNIRIALPYSRKRSTWVRISKNNPSLFLPTKSSGSENLLYPACSKIPAVNENRPQILQSLTQNIANFTMINKFYPQRNSRPTRN